MLAELLTAADVASLEHILILDLVGTDPKSFRVKIQKQKPWILPYHNFKSV